MTELFQEKPNVVHIVVEDRTGKAERWATGKTLGEVLAALGGEPKIIKRRTRRTKKEMAAQAEPEKAAEPADDGEPKSVTAEAKKRGRVFP